MQPPISQFDQLLLPQLHLPLNNLQLPPYPIELLFLLLVIRIQVRVDLATLKIRS
jgi:hypothetical protein